MTVIFLTLGGVVNKKSKDHTAIAISKLTPARGSGPLRRLKSGSEAKPRVGEVGFADRRGDDLRSSSW